MLNWPAHSVVSVCVLIQKSNVIDQDTMGITEKDVFNLDDDPTPFHSLAVMMQ